MDESSEGEAQIELFGEDSEMNRDALTSGDFASAGIEDLVDETADNATVTNKSAGSNEAVIVTASIISVLALSCIVAAVVFFMRRRKAASASAGGGGTTSKATNAAGPTGAGVHRYAPSGEDSDFGDIMGHPSYSYGNNVQNRGAIVMATHRGGDDSDLIDL